MKPDSMKRTGIWGAVFSLLPLAFLLFFTALPSRQAAAVPCPPCCCGSNGSNDCSCSVNAIPNVVNQEITQNEDTRDFMGYTRPINTDYSQNAEACTGLLGQHQDRILRLWYDPFVRPLLQMTQEFTVVTMEHAFLVGTFIDAKNQMETQALFQEKTAEAHKDYHPSVGMCVFGTNVRSLAVSQRRAEATANLLSDYTVGRGLSRAGGSAARGKKPESRERVVFFRDRVCDRLDNDRIIANPATGFSLICSANPRANGGVNRDLDFTRNMMLPRTIDMDLLDQTAPNTDRDYIFSLSRNLHGFSPPDPLPRRALENVANGPLYLELRSLTARRSVATAPFDALAGLKSVSTPAQTGGGNPPPGSTGTLNYMVALLRELGMSDAEARKLMGAQPSYYAQMEVLAKKMYQRPGFYVDLYDKPMNVKRKSAAMQAVNLMLDREIYESYLRSEAILSQILELRVADKQRAVEAGLARK